ncbi:MAG: hypothetical protein JJV88_00290 [Sulfurovum sp.]|nr:hypothetical protein [Sulfurovaceae bacterium]
MVIDFYDGNTLMFQAIRTANKGVSYEILSKSGSAVKKNIQNEMNKSRVRRQTVRTDKRTRTSRNPVHSALTIAKTNRGEMKLLGERQGQDGRNMRSSKNSMGNLITSFLMEKTGTLVVGGVHKSFVPNIRRDGVVIKTGARVKGTSRETQAIIHNLDTGNKNHPQYGMGRRNEIKRGSSLWNEHSYNVRDGRGFGFIKRGYRNSKPYIREQLTNGYIKTLGRAVNKIKINTRPQKVA